ncbi:MAG: hypothetical protein ABR540_22065 [Acidimicrobiales bacterium]|nr:hypothetical protein [Actinomycetota bacterium]
MAPRLVRWVVVAVCAAGIAGMIVASIADATGAALTFGLITAAAVACLMVATAVAAPSPGTAPVDDVRAARVEEMVQNLVAAGADEGDLRRLVREASRLRIPTS